MDADPPKLTVAATKPGGKTAGLLVGMGIAVAPILEDEGNVDRYVLSKRLAVDRRTGSGFLQGIMDKTLFVSAIYLREHFRMPVLIVEGQINYEYSRFDPQAVRGAMSAMILQYGINVLSTASIEETAALLAMMTRQEQIGIPEISLIPKRKAADLPDLQRRVVEMLPGCGMVLARDLLQHFGSVRRIANATDEEFRALRGIGAKKAAEMYKALTAEYHAIDTERDLEDAIQVSPNLLFAQSVELLARQHHIFTEEKERHVVDLVFRDPATGELILVELKRGKLYLDHYRQIRRYLDNARKSKLLRPLLDEGADLRGILATVEPCELKTKDPHVATQIVDAKKVLAVLKAIRDRKWGSS